ncbi:MAG: hypothetical protein AB8B66_02240 [Rickettsiaceae bacterium]
MFKFCNRKTSKPKCQTAEEYWQEMTNRNIQKSEALGVGSEELNETSFLDQDSKYQKTIKGM